MKAKIEFDIKPLLAGEHVVVEYETAPPPDGSAPLPPVPPASPSLSLHVRNLDADTLDKLCEEYTNDMFQAAGLKRPPQVVGVAEKEPLVLSMQWLKGDLFVNGVVISNVYGGDSRYVGSVMLPNPPTYKSVFATEGEARKEMERVVMTWFERMTGESYV